MTYIRIIVFTVLSFTLIGNAQAGNSPLYLGVGITEFETTGLDTNLSGTYINLGMDLGNYFALEGVGSNSEQYASSSTAISTFEIDYIATGLLRFNLRYDHVTLYAMAGYSRFKLTVNSGGTNSTFTNHTEVYGAGIDIYGTKQTAISVRWYNYGKDANLDESNVTSIGLHFYFDVPRIDKRY